MRDPASMRYSIPLSPFTSGHCHCLALHKLMYLLQLVATLSIRRGTAHIPIFCVLYCGYKTITIAKTC
jgi:hypothetical protein